MTALFAAAWVGAVGDALVSVNFRAIQQTSVADRLLGRVIASSQALMSVAAIAGLLAGGVLGDSLGLRGAILVASVGHLTILASIALSPLRRLSAPPAAVRVA